MNRKQLFRLMAIIFFLFIAGAGYSQQTGTLITGKIVGKDNLPLAGVSVQVKDKPNISTATDSGGVFRIKSPTPSGILVFTMIGFQEREVHYSGAENLNLKLEESVSMLHDVILTGYSETEEK